MNDFELLQCKRKESIMEDIMQLCDVVRETGFAIHRYHKHGHLEKVYENALAHRLRKLGLDVKQQHPLKVYDEDGTLIGDYNADLFVDNRLIIELKAAKALADEHVAQILGYLRSSRVEHGLLINFGAPKFEIKKYALSRIGEGPAARAASSEELFPFLRLLRLFAAIFHWVSPMRPSTLELCLQTAGRKELTRWILSWMPHVKVLAPRQLRDRVRERMREGLAQCG